jgi:hypothetical protein
MMRHLQPHQDEEYDYNERKCPAIEGASSCPIAVADDTPATTTSSSSSSSNIADSAIGRMNQSVTMLPRICDIQSAQDVVGSGISSLP